MDHRFSAQVYSSSVAGGTDPPAPLLTALLAAVVDVFIRLAIDVDLGDCAPVDHP